jgi:hypothetical protein
MKKLLLTLSSIAMLTLAPLTTTAGAWTIGASLSSNSLDTATKEDVDNNGTIDDKKTVSDDFIVGSIFLENTVMGEKGGITFGVDYIPFDADIDKRSITQSTVKGRTEGAASSGTNSVSASIKDHTTFYVQPGVKFGENSMFYLSYGIIMADIHGKSTSISHTDISKTKSMDGEKIGIGIKTVKDSGLVLKLDISESSYDKVTFTTDNDTKGTADLDNTAITFSIGKQF